MKENDKKSVIEPKITNPNGDINSENINLPANQNPTPIPKKTKSKD